MFSESLVGRKDWYSSKCALIWKLKVTASSRMYFQLAVSMHRTGDTEHGSSPILPTVQTQGLKICRNGRMEPLPLMLLPTPKSNDYRSGMPNRVGTDHTQQLDDTIAYRIGMTSRLNPLFVEEMMGFPSGWILLPFLRVSTSDSADAAAM